MKKTYKTLSGLLALSVLLSLDLSAQLSGVYTINSASVTAGTNFQSFSALAATINTAGISAPVTINVASNSGPYNEQVEFMAITGTSVSNTITINGNGNTVAYSATSTTLPHTILFSGADYMTVNSLTVQGTGGTYAMTLHMYNQSSNNTFNNCRFEAPINVSGSKQVPVSLSGSSNVVASSGNAGDNNKWIGCSTSGGVRGIAFYCNTSTPYNFGNQVLNCAIRDFYQYGLYNYYTQNLVLRGNTIERLNQTSFTTSYGIYVSANCYPATIEKNRIRRMFDGSNASGSTCYGIYMASGAVQGSVNVISNNLISDITSNGTIYGIYDGFNSYNNFYNNTIVLDNSVSTSGSVYGIWSYSSLSDVKNNLVSIARTGSGTKYCIAMYNPGTLCDNNILYMNSPAGFNYIGYNSNTGNTYANLAAWKASSSFDASSVSGNPVFTNPTIYDYTPTTAALNNVGSPTVGVTTDINNLARNIPAPDAGAFEFFNTLCTSVTGTNAIISPTNIICPTAMTPLSLANGYTVNGITYVWGISNNVLGPFTPISGATLAAYITPTLNANVYYNVIIGCSQGGLSYTTAPGLIQIANTTTNTIPYYESFEGITMTKELPNCSWARSDAYQCGTQTVMISQWRQARTGTKFAEFDASNNVYNQTRYFYTNGIYLNVGVTYSASLWYNTPGNPTWNNLTMLYGTSQSPGNLTQIATVGSMVNTTYLPLTNTFTVSASGLYYIAIRAYENSWGQQVVWDDLSITIPCELPANSAPLTVTGPSTLCAGQVANITANGAGTYTWSSGPNTNTINPVLQFNTTYSVTGTNIVSGCTITVAKTVLVRQLPPVTIGNFDSPICKGNSATLKGLGANSYTWSAGPSQSSSITVSPLATTSYTLLGSDYYGCVGTAVQQVIVNPLPIPAVTGNTLICEGVSTNLSATGAGNSGTYEWKANNLYLLSPVALVAPLVTTAYTLTGTDVNMCKGSSIVLVVVDPCTGLQTVNGTSQGVLVYPNPGNGIFTVELNNGLNKTIEVLDVTGRLVLSTSTLENTYNVNISDLSMGVYYIKVKSDNKTDILKVVKQ